MANPLIRATEFGLVRSSPPVEGKPKVYTFRANDGDFDRYQDRNKVAGWKLDSYRANPVVLLNHDDRQLPIGKGRVYPEGDALMVDIEFDQDDELAKRVESKIEKKILNAVSVRYLLQDGKFKVNERGGLDSEEQELLEVSVVTIPGNQRAVRVKEFAEFEATILPKFAAMVGPMIEAAVAKALAPPAKADPVEEVEKFLKSHKENLARSIEQALKEKQWS